MYEAATGVIHIHVIHFNWCDKYHLLLIQLEENNNFININYYFAFVYYVGIWLVTRKWP